MIDGRPKTSVTFGPRLGLIRGKVWGIRQIIDNLFWSCAPDRVKRTIPDRLVEIGPQVADQAPGPQAFPHIGEGLLHDILRLIGPLRITQSEEAQGPVKTLELRFKFSCRDCRRHPIAV